MATILYTCDTCKRDIELLENKNGLTVFSRCVITEGCKGTLYKTDRNPDSLRESFPLDVQGLTNYTPRRTFHSFTQNISSTIWKVNHELGVFPAITVYTRGTTGNFIEVNPDDYTINIINNNSFDIIFTQPINGIVHSVARSSTISTPTTIPPDSALFQISNDAGLLTFAIPILSAAFNVNGEIKIEICVTIPNEEEITCVETIPNNIDLNSPWLGVNQILIRRRRTAIVRTLRITDFLVFANIEDIPFGTTLEIKRIKYSTNTGFVPLESRALFLLLANPPFSSVDKISDKIIDLGELQYEDINTLFINNNEVFSDLSAIENIYPDIVEINNGVV